MWLCNTEVTLACQNTRADAWQRGNLRANVFEVMFLTHSLLHCFCGCRWVFVFLRLRARKRLNECSTRTAERVFASAIMGNIVMHNATEEHFGKLWSIYNTSFLSSDLWDSQPAFSVCLLFSAPLPFYVALDTMAQQMVGKYTVSIRIIIHKEQLTKTLYLFVYFLKNKSVCV